MKAQPPRMRMESSLPVPSSRASSAEDSNASGEGRVRKFQRTSGTDHSSTRRKSSAPSVTSAPRPPSVEAPKNNFRGRRQSLREGHKAPLGPRPYEKQRVISNALPQSRTFPTLNEEAPAAPQRYYAKQQAQPAAADSSGMFDRPNFIPDVTFDDFANRLYQQEALSKFPSPPPSATLPSPPGPATHMASQPQAQPQPKQSGPASSVHATPTFTGSSLVRRFSQSRANPPPSAPEENTSIPPPQTNMAIRTRRQSQFPAQAPSNPAARAPRKSVGPGMFPTPTFDSRQASDNIRTRVGRTPSFGQGNRRGPLPANVSTGAEIPRMPNAARSTKAKSFHASSKQPQSMLTASMDSEQGGLPITQARSPIRPTVRTQTPSSTSSKRQSTIQHVSGLGARTISPTDARRLKRLSMNPNAVIQGAPRSPGTPQAEFSYDERVLDQSPAPVFRKSVTPSSARETPEQNRKSYASGISLSSNSSINSLRMANGTLQPRQGPAFLGSRLPTPKPRNVHSSTGGEEEEEEVPPVPAIPKAYESPKDPEHSRFSFATAAAKGAMANYTAEGVSSTEFEDLDTQGMETKKTAFPTQRESSIRHRRGLTVGAGSPADKSPAVASKKKNLQPIQLPPLNLLPLGSSFNNRMSSFPAPSAEVDVRHTTPPMQRASNKTPSTPMTASRASFFSNNNHQGQRDTNQLRTSSSAFNLRAGGAAEPTLHGASAMPIPTLNPPTRQMTTPFSSNSLPKNSGEFSQLRPRPSGEYHGHTDVELQNMKVQGPRALARKETADSVQTSTSTEPETPSSGGSSLRRKLSLSGWRRASSKAATHGPNVQTRSQTQKGEDQPPQPPKHSDMPPPRLPASATWTGGLGASPTPAKSSRPSLDFGRRKTSTTNIASDVEVDKNRSHKAHGSLTVRVPSAYAEPSSAQPTPKSGSSILTPMQRILGSKSSTNMLKARNLDSNLDKDDLVADEEMKKLASKRKDFEQAARDVDELRKRARPQERVSAAQALQMVNLNIFERGEIIDYKEIYFCGTKSAKKHVGDLNATTANFGYDDDRGDYNIVFGDHLAYRYEVVDMLGKGSFGQVVRCVDHKTGSLVAIKIIRNKKRFHQQALVEVNILKKLREWDPDNKHSMVNFTSSFYFRGHLCISTELLGMNLYEFIKAHEFKGFSLRLIRRFSKQMLSSLVCLKSHRVIHCDLKPENILLAHPLHSELKVIDFGSSCLDNEKVYTYIQSRFYRSPEVILGMSYGMPIDMWSLGCILAELLTGYPIFPGENEQEQLACIMEIFGPPEKHLIEKSSRKKLFFDSLGKPRVTVSTKGRRRRPSSKTLQQALKCDDDAFLDFIARCLRWDPERRMKPDEAMLHEFVTGVKRVARPRVQANTANTSSPVKRVPPSQTPSSRVRPLPEPPATSFKNTAAVNQNREISGSSPVKSGPRRLSTVQGAPGGIKRTAYGAPLNPGSGLPRVAQRSTSGRTDLASAAAVASLKSAR